MKIGRHAEKFYLFFPKKINKYIKIKRKNLVCEVNQTNLIYELFDVNEASCYSWGSGLLL